MFIYILQIKFDNCIGRYCDISIEEKTVASLIVNRNDLIYQ